MLPLESLEQREAVFHFLQPGWRRVDAVREVAEREGQIFELSLDAVPVLPGTARSERRSVASSLTRFHTCSIPASTACSAS